MEGPLNRSTQNGSDNMSSYHIQLLGPPAVYYDGEPLAIQRRLTRALLYYLACQTEPIDRAHLMLLLWPEANESTGRKRLRETLGKLRGDLPDPDLLSVIQDQVSIDHQRATVDALEFNRLYQSSYPVANSIPSDLPLPAHTHQSIQAALQLWHSPSFMSGVLMPKSPELDNWLAETASQFERRRVVLIDRLSSHYAASGDFESAISWLNQIMEVDPDNLTWQMRQLKWLHRLGQRSEAQAYSNYLSSYYQEAGEPLPDELLAIAAQLQRLDLPEITRPHPSWPPPAILQTNFTGREGQLQALQGALQRGGVCLLLGESGSGKTRLLYEFWQRRAREVRLLVAVARPSSQSLPYQPMVDMLRHDVTDKEWARLSPNWIRPLNQLLPELNHFLGQPARFEDTLLDDVQSVCFECLHQVLEEISAGNRVLFILEDAQFCDKTSLDALAYLANRGFFEKNGLLAITARVEELSDGLKQFLEQLRESNPHLLEMLLPELTPGEASDLVTAVLGKPYPDAVVQRLLENAGGQPLHLIETLRSVLDYSPGINLDEVVHHLPLPNSIRELVHRKMSLLSPAALKVLQIAAINTDSISPALIEKAAGLEAEEVVCALEELETRRLITVNPAHVAGPNYQFQYSRIRKAVLTEISEARKRMLHLSVASAMQSLPVESNNPAEIARHFEAAGELKAAFDYWLRAGLKNIEMYSSNETITSFRKAQSMLSNLGDFVSDQEIYQLFLAWGDFLDNCANFPAGVQLFYDLQTLGEQRQSNLLLGQAFNGLARVYRRMEAYDKSLKYNDLALIHLETDPFMPEYLFAHNRRAVTLAFLDDFEGSVLALQKAFELSKNNKDRRVQIGISGVCLQISWIWFFKGLPHRSLEIAELASRSIFSSINNPDLELMQIVRAQAYAFQGFPRKAYQLCQEVLKKAQEWNHQRLEAYARMVKSFAAMALGYMDEALEDMETTLSIAMRFKFNHVLQQTYTNLSDFYRLLHAYKLAEGANRKSLQNATHPYYRLDNEIRLAYNRFHQGAVNEGLSMLEPAIQEAEQNGFTYIQFSAQIMQVVMLIQKNEIEQATRIIEQLIQESEARELVIVKANISMYAGICDLKRGRLAEARQRLETALQITQQNGNVWVEAATWHLLGPIYAAQGEDAWTSKQHLARICEHILKHTHRPELREMLLSAFGQGMPTD